MLWSFQFFVCIWDSKVQIRLFNSIGDIILVHLTKIVGKIGLEGSRF